MENFLLNVLIYVTLIGIIVLIGGLLSVAIILYTDCLYPLLLSGISRIKKYEPRLDLDKEEPDAWCGTPMAVQLEKDIINFNKQSNMNNDYPKEDFTKANDNDGDGDNNQIDTNDIDDEFGMDFLSDKFKEGDEKVANGEISCNLDNPEDCEACGS
jgi:hypothetical protein